MTAGILRFENTRILLSKAIADTLQAWPEQHRLIFTRIHYGGRDAEEVATSIGLRAGEVEQIRETCERKLRVALRSFSDPNHKPHSEDGLHSPSNLVFDTRSRG